MRRCLKALPYSLIVIISAPLVMVYLWLFLNSVSGKVLYGLIPTAFTLENWRFLWAEIPYGLGTLPNVWPVLANTLIVGIGVALLTLLVCGLAGYAISRFEFRGRGGIMQLIVVLRAFPVLILLIATFYILHYLQLLDTLLAVILVRTAMELVMGTWIIKGFFDDVPREVEEAALIDGATRFQVWRKIMFPLVKPGLVAVSIIAFMGGWSDFVFVYTFLFDRSKWTLSVLLYEIIGGFEALDYSLLAAISIFYMLPPLVLYTITQKAFMKTTLVGIE